MIRVPTGLLSLALLVMSPTVAYAQFNFDNILEDIGKSIEETYDKGKKAIEGDGNGAQQQQTEPTSPASEQQHSVQSDAEPTSSDQARYDRPWILEIQQRLTDLGYQPGPVDGAIGNKTRVAINNFQQSKRMPVTGQPTPSLMQELRAASALSSQPQQEAQVPVQAASSGPTKSSVSESDPGKPIISLESDILTAGQTVKITVKNLPGNAQDWLTLVARDAPPTTFGKWFYTAGVSEGAWTFRAPSKPGAYEVRVYFNFPTGGYTVQARQAVQVVDRQQAAALPPKAPSTAPSTPATVPGTATRAVDNPGLPFGAENFASTMAGLLRGPAQEADRTLKAMGYRLLDARNNCAYQRDTGTTVRALIVFTNQPNCTGSNAEVTKIQATETLKGQLIAVKPEIQGLNREIELESDCTKLADNIADCKWTSPPSLPKLRVMTVRLSSDNIPNATIYRRYVLFPKTLTDDRQIYQKHKQQLDKVLPGSGRNISKPGQGALPKSPVARTGASSGQNQATAPAAKVASQTSAKTSTPFGTANFAGTLVRLLGKPAASADKLVKQLGYKHAVTADACVYQQYSGGVSRSIKISTNSRKCDVRNGLVTGIWATETLSAGQVVSTKAEIQNLNREFQAASKCPKLTERDAGCSWQVPPGMPMLEKFEVRLASYGVGAGMNTRHYAMKAANVAQATSGKAAAPVPATPAQSAAASNSNATSPAAYFYGLIDELLSDKEFRSGIPATQINDFLKSRGFVRKTRKVEFIHINERGRSWVSVIFSCSGREECRNPTGIVEDISISGGAIPSTQTPPNMSSIFAKHFGLEPKCRINNGRGPENTFGKTVAVTCNWDLAPGQHRFRALRLSGMESRFQMTLFADQ